MLAAAQRLTRSQDFARTIRTGQRAGRRTLVAHLLLADDATHPPRAGLVVSRAVGGSVVRHRVSRRLRHLLRPELTGLPDGTLLVIRALPAAAEADSGALGRDLASAVRAAYGRAGRTVQTCSHTPAAPAGNG